MTDFDRQRLRVEAVEKPLRRERRTMSSGGTRRKRARATSGCGWSAWLRKARRTLTTASSTFRGGG